MSRGFFKNLFRKRESEYGEPDLRGPLDLGPGDTVLYYQHEYLVTGVILLLEGTEHRYQYHLMDRRREHRVLTAEEDQDVLLTLQEILNPDLVDYDGSDDTFTWNGHPFTLTHRGRATAWCLGDLPPEKVNEVAYREFENEAEEAIFTIEHWGRHLEARAGEYIHEGELTLRRRGEEEFELRAPPRIDMKSLNEARQAHQAAEGSPAPARTDADELAAVREKLRRLKEHEDALEAAKAREKESEPSNFLGI